MIAVKNSGASRATAEGRETAVSWIEVHDTGECPEVERYDWLLDGHQAMRERLLKGDRAGAGTMLARSMRRRLREFPCEFATGPAMAGDVMENATAILRGEVNLLGFGPVYVGEMVDWTTRIDEDVQWTIHLNYLYWLDTLVEAWRQTGDEAYPARWIEVVRQFLATQTYGNAGSEYSPSQPCASNVRKTCNNGESWGGADVWISLACHIRVDSFLRGMVAFANSSSITDSDYLRIADAICGDHQHVMVMNPRENTPNQFLSITMSLIRIGVFLPECRGANAAFEIGMARASRAIARVLLPDGSDLEQSFNYNVRFCDAMLELADLFAPNAPERCDKFLDAARRRAAFLRCITTPDGRMMAVAKSSRESLAEKLRAWEARLGTLDPAQPSDATFGSSSRAFPYGGYYMLRGSTASSRGDYLFFKASPHGIGHMHEDCLSLHLCAGGRDLVVDSGNYSYTNQTPLDEALNRYAFSTRAHAAVLIDGQGQDRLGLRAGRSWRHDEAPNLRAVDASPLPGRALRGRYFELVEGEYADGFGPRGQIAAVHVRRVVWIRGLGWLVLDRLDGVARRTCTQVWTLAPEFAGAVKVQADHPGLFSAQITDRMVTVFAMTSEASRVDHFCGSDDPVAGWMMPTYGKRIPKPDICVSWEPERRCSIG
jgi:hypothetical protein